MFGVGFASTIGKNRNCGVGNFDCRRAHPNLCSRIGLMLDGGMPWETYRVERDSFAMSYQSVI